MGTDRDDPAPREPAGTESRGAYALRVFAIDRRPEGRAAEYALGDTVSNEPLYPAGDVDEYTFTLASETALRIFWKENPHVQPETAVWGILFDEGTGTRLWSNFDSDQGAPIRRITLPAGRYRLSVLNQNVRAGADLHMVRIPTLPYSFAFIPD